MKYKQVAIWLEYRCKKYYAYKGTQPYAGVCEPYTEPLRHLYGTSAEPLRHLCGTSAEPPEPLRHLYRASLARLLWNLLLCRTSAAPLRIPAGNVASVEALQTSAAMCAEPLPAGPLQNLCGTSTEPLRHLYTEPASAAALELPVQNLCPRDLCRRSAEPLQNLCGSSTEPLRHLYGTYAEPLRHLYGSPPEPLRDLYGTIAEPMLYRGMCAAEPLANLFSTSTETLPTRKL